ncbi:MAG: 3-keto-5-aminohexanoate cleavage protein [candidate division Zixibacteria bacterium]|nr:3-keto-5-aminohexanoate cleavage protein [candidate division Zixibacteria bacterium]
MDKLIVTAAVTGSVTPTDKTPHIPVTPKEIADEAIACYHEGASVAHIHVRDPKTKKPSMKSALYAEVVDRIKSECNMIINLTTGMGARIVMTEKEKEEAGEALFTTPERRTEHIVLLSPEMCSLDVGTMNFGSWIFANPFPVIEKMAAIIRDAGVKPEIEIFDTGHVDIAEKLISKGLIRQPAHYQFCMGVTGGLSATPKNLLHLVETIPEKSTWSVLGVGASQFPMVTLAMALGGHVRVGFEDNLYISKGILAKSNTEFVKKVAEAARMFGRQLANPDEARAILDVGKGG